MNYSIIGTAGHVDHGKTCLIKALTGIETDRLGEEKKRGITIDLGFAHIKFSDGSQASIIDVPGHEKFIKNMLAGASGIDLVLMVIAADEGIMPQTKEHIDILTLLGIKKGIVVLTKSDMVDEDWLLFMEEEIKEKLQHSFLKDAPIVPVSAQTGQGIENLRDMIYKMLQQQDSDRNNKRFRIPIDRIFSVEGFGAVITGTMIEGKVSVGDNLMIYPSMLETKARNIQVHSQDVQTAYSGQRTAVNLAGIKKSDIKRGDILAPKDSVAVTDFIDVKINMLADTNRIIKNNSDVHFHHGSGEMVAKVVLFGKDKLSKGESGYAQLRCTENFAAKAGDPFVLRFISPLETIAGGVILNTMPAKRKRADENALKIIETFEKGNNSEKVSAAVSDCGSLPVSINDISIRVNISPDEVKTICDKLDHKKEITEVAEGLYIHKNEIERIKKAAESLLSVYHRENPLKAGIKREELRTKLRPNMEMTHIDRIFNQLINQKFIKEDKGIISLYAFEVVVNEDSQKIHNEIIKAFDDGKFSPPSPDEIAAKYPKLKNINQIFSKMITDGDLVRLSEKIFMSKASYNEALEKIKALESEKGEIILADVRDVLNTSRKYALGLLEYWDNKKITKKNGDIRHFSK